MTMERCACGEPAQDRSLYCGPCGEVWTFVAGIQAVLSLPPQVVDRETVRVPVVVIDIMTVSIDDQGIETDLRTVEVLVDASCALNHSFLRGGRAVRIEGRDRASGTLAWYTSAPQSWRVEWSTRPRT